jgi:hypothetical protein
MDKTFFESKPGMPTGQHNANLADSLVMRVGIPHKGGSLAFHALSTIQ